MVNVTIYIAYMDPMGQYINVVVHPNMICLDVHPNYSSHNVEESTQM